MCRHPICCFCQSPKENQRRDISGKPRDVTEEICWNVMNDFFQRMLFNHYLVEQQVCGMFYRIGQRIFASEILGLNQHLFTRRSWKLNNTYTSPIIYTQKAHLLALKPVPLTASSISLYKKTISGWEWRMELALPRVFLGGTYRWGTKLPPAIQRGSWVDFWSSRACCKFVTLAASQVVMKKSTPNTLRSEQEFIRVDGCQKHNEMKAMHCC